MGGFALGALATAVTRAGGLGLIGSDGDMKNLATQLAQVDKDLDRHDGLLPIGVGLLGFVTKEEGALPLLEKFKPAVVWLFAAKDINDYNPWTESVRRVSPRTQVWIQIGSVEGALSIAKNARPDVLCIQGSDAGGHGYEKGAGIISLLPEVADALSNAGFGHIRLVTAGGIGDGRAAAAAFTLGAQGVVLGTRFLAASETKVHPEYRKAVLAANDGGQRTVRSKLFDNLRGPNVWPGLYDGRSIEVESFKDHVAGVEIEEIRKRHKEAMQTESKGFAEDGSGRAAMWAGTGVGLVKKEQPAAEIVEEVRAGIVKALEAANARL
jgi:nitronate monooxygenase